MRTLQRGIAAHWELTDLLPSRLWSVLFDHSQLCSRDGDRTAAYSSSEQYLNIAALSVPVPAEEITRKIGEDLKLQRTVLEWRCIRT